MTQIDKKPKRPRELRGLFGLKDHANFVVSLVWENKEKGGVAVFFKKQFQTLLCLVRTTHL
jgi:hypothetical protein